MNTIYLNLTIYKRQMLRNNIYTLLRLLLSNDSTHYYGIYNLMVLFTFSKIKNWFIVHIVYTFKIKI